MGSLSMELWMDSLTNNALDPIYILRNPHENSRGIPRVIFIGKACNSNLNKISISLANQGSTTVALKYNLHDIKFNHNAMSSWEIWKRWQFNKIYVLPHFRPYIKPQVLPVIRINIECYERMLLNCLLALFKRNYISVSILIKKILIYIRTFIMHLNFFSKCIDFISYFKFFLFKMLNFL